jgi:hypothetical protein
VSTNWMSADTIQQMYQLLARLEFEQHALAAEQAAVARATIEPMPVAERPWEREGWCNSDNEAFFFDSDTKKWSLCECDKYSPVMTNASDRYTHSLPHHALPVPGAEVG